jgi:hypothetical protein
MNRKINLILVMVCMVLLTALPAVAGSFVGPGSEGWGADFGYYGYSALGLGTAPAGWTENHYYTHQGWDFVPVPDSSEPGTYTGFDMPLAPDSDTYGGPGNQNPFGTPTFYETGQSQGFAWTLTTDYGMGGMANFDFYGHVGGMGSGYAAFYLPNEANPEMVKHALVEYIVYLNRATTPEEMITEFASDGAINYAEGMGDGFLDANLIGEMKSREWEQLDGPGGTGYWWHVTEEWVMPQLDAEYFYLQTTYGTATLIDAVDIQTICSPVPIPGAVWLLGGGILGLVGLRRRSNKA